MEGEQTSESSIIIVNIIIIDRKLLTVGTVRRIYFLSGTKCSSFNQGKLKGFVV